MSSQGLSSDSTGFFLFTHAWLTFMSCALVSADVMFLLSNFSWHRTVTHSFHLLHTTAHFPCLFTQGWHELNKMVVIFFLLILCSIYFFVCLLLPACDLIGVKNRAGSYSCVCSITNSVSTNGKRKFLCWMPAVLSSANEGRTLTSLHACCRGDLSLKDAGFEVPAWCVNEARQLRLLQSRGVELSYKGQN